MRVLVFVILLALIGYVVYTSTPKDVKDAGWGLVRRHWWKVLLLVAVILLGAGLLTLSPF